MIGKMWMLVLVVVVVVIGATLTNGGQAQAAGTGRPYGAQGEEGPDFGGCGVYGWEKDVVWFVWDQPPAGAVRFQVTFYLKDLRTGVEFLSGSESDAIYYQGDLFGYYEYAFEDSRIRNLTCIAVMEDGSKWSTSSNREWFVYFRFLPVLFRSPTITAAPEGGETLEVEVHVEGASYRAARVELWPIFEGDTSEHKIPFYSGDGDCGPEDGRPVGTCEAYLDIYADEAVTGIKVEFWEWMGEEAYYEQTIFGRWQR